MIRRYYSFALLAGLLLALPAGARADFGFVPGSHNGKEADSKPVVKAIGCKGTKARKRERGS
jgi:hypothetical protein